MRNRKVWLTLIFLSFCFDIFSQSSSYRREDYWTVGVQANLFNYFGDLNPINQRVSTELSFTRPNFAIEVTRKVGAFVHLRAALAYGRLKGDDFIAADPNKLESFPRYTRNLHFRNDILELSVVGIFEFFPSRGRFYRRQYFTPYLMGGIAFFYHNPKARVPDNYTGSDASPGDWVALRPLSTEGQGLVRQTGPNAGVAYPDKYSLFQPAIPLGAGVRWRIGDRFDLSLEIGFRLTFFDYIDDVGGTYPYIEDLPEGVARALFERSAEPVAASAEQNRDLARIESFYGPATTLYGSVVDPQRVNFTDGSFNRFSGFGLDGDQRGDKQGENDMYVVTGFRLNYILTTRRIARYNDRNSRYIPSRRRKGRRR